MVNRSSWLISARFTASAALAALLMALLAGCAQMPQIVEVQPATDSQPVSVEMSAQPLLPTATPIPQPDIEATAQALAQLYLAQTAEATPAPTADAQATAQALAQRYLTQTAEAAPTATATTSPAAGQALAVTETITAAASIQTTETTAEPAATATPLAASEPIVEVLVPALNVRSGPGTVYPRIGQATAGERLKILAKAPENEWLRVCCVDGDQPGWLSGDPSFVTQSGPLDQVAVAAAEDIPPAPTPAPAPVAAAASAAAPAPAGGGFFGYGIQVTRFADVGRGAGMAQELGMQWVKVQIPWKDYEREPGNIRWGDLDPLVGALNGAGLNILFSVPKAPDWARPGNTDFGVEGPPTDPGAYANFVGALAGRYRGRVQAYEIWNEQNMWYEWGGEPFDAGRYVRLLCASYGAIKGQDPGAIVISGAPTPTGAGAPWAVPDRDYLRQMYNAGLKGCADAVGVHPSGYGNSPDSSFYAGGSGTPSHNNHPSFYFLDTIRDYRQIMLEYGDTNRRLWATEFGWASIDGLTPQPAPGYEYALYVNQQQQANYLIRALQIGRESGYMGPMFIWNLNFAVSSGPQDEKAAFSLVKPGWDHRPAYDAIVNARRDGTLP